MIKFNYKNILEKFSEITDSNKPKSVFSPHRDWKIIVTVFFSLFVLLGAANIYFFTLVDNEKIFFKKEKVSIKNLEVLNILELKNTIEFFEKKEKKFKTLSKEKQNIVDPSL